MLYQEKNLNLKISFVFFKNWLPYWMIDGFKILLWCVVLYFLRESNYNFFLLLIFLILSGYILFTPKASLFFTHLTLFILAPFLLSFIHSHLNLILAVLYFGASLFILTLSKNPLFLFRGLTYRISFIAVLLVVFLTFFISGAIQKFIFKELTIFLFIFCLFGEFLNQSDISALSSKRKVLFSLIFSLMAVEIFWAVSLLPIGFINSSIFLALIVYSIANFLLDYLKGFLNRRKLIEHFTVFVILTLLIFAFSKWTI